MGNIKICFVLSHFPQGGAERQVLELIKGLLVKNCEVTLMLYQSDQIFYEELKELDIKFICNLKKTSSVKFVKWINNILFLRNNLKKESYNIIHTYLFFNGLVVRLFAPKKYFGKTVYSIRNSYESVSKLYYFIDKLLNKRAINIYNSKKSFQQLYAKPPISVQKNNLVIYNGFDVKKFYRNTKICSQVITLGVVGRLTIQKNQIQVLRVLKKIKNDSKRSFKLYLIGDNDLDEAENIKKYINNNGLSEDVVLLDAQNNIEEYYRRFDIFILSSLYEGCPNVLFEALLSKCLCIISKGSNSDLFIKDGFNGFQYDGTDKSLEEKIVESIKLIGTGDANRVRENGYNYAYSNFSLKKMVDNYIDVYNKILPFF
jgi:glycosyltransferase involved in cell wall biosynthesis